MRRLLFGLFRAIAFKATSPTARAYNILATEAHGNIVPTVKQTESL